MHHLWEAILQYCNISLSERLQLMKYIHHILPSLSSHEIGTAQTMQLQSIDVQYTV